MNEKLNIIMLKLAEIGKELNRKFGTDSYELRCALFDIREELSKLSQHNVIKNEVAVCECPPPKDFAWKDNVKNYVCRICNKEKQTVL